MRFKRNRLLEAGGLDIAPLIDVVLLLLIFFMLSSSFILPSGIRIDLPQSSASEVQDRESVTITISENDELFLDERNISWDNLKEALTTHRLVYPERVLIIKADRKVYHGKVVEVMSQAKEAKWKRLAIAAQPRDED